MPKVKTEFIRVGHESDPDHVKWRFNVEININSKGVFYTYVPPAILQRLQFGNVKFDNPVTKGREGCLTAASIAGVVDRVKEACREASTRTEISQETVIKYAIRTTCRYCLNKDGEPVPNGQQIWTELPREAYEWKGGTIDQYAQSPQAFGFEIYAKPFWRRVYLYCNGRQSTEYEPIYDVKDKASHYYLAWLAGVCAVTVPDSTKLHEIEYTEEIAQFFAETYKSICKLNESIKGLIDPAGIRLIAATKTKMLNNE